MGVSGFLNWSYLDKPPKCLLSQEATNFGVFVPHRGGGFDDFQFPSTVNHREPISMSYAAIDYAPKPRDRVPRDGIRTWHRNTSQQNCEPRQTRPFLTSTPTDTRQRRWTSRAEPECAKKARGYTSAQRASGVAPSQYKNITWFTRAGKLESALTAAVVAYVEPPLVAQNSKVALYPYLRFQ